MVLKNLIANLPFSPAVAGQIGFYVKRLKQEEFSRRLGLVFTSMALVFQSFAIIAPPQPTIAAGPNNIIFQGITSKADLLGRYDNNDDGNGNKDLQQIFEQFGINRSDLDSGVVKTINSRDQNLKLWSIGRQAYNKPGEYAQPIDGTDTTVYVRPLWSWDSSSFGSNYKSLTGTTSDGRYFAVLFNCGNLVINIDEKETPEQPVGFVEHSCDVISGWVYDPNDLKHKTTVVVYVRLETGGTTATKQIVADDPSPSSPVGDGYGFTYLIPEDKKSETLKTVYTVIALDDSGDAKDTELARTVTFDTPCLTPQPPEEPAADKPTTGKLIDNTCSYIKGYAYDKDDLNETIDIRVKLELQDGSVEASPWQSIKANLASPEAGVAGSHGFKLDITDTDNDIFDQWKSSESGTLATVQMKDLDTGAWVTIVNKKLLSPNPCLETVPKEEPVCDFNELLLASDPKCRECPYQPGIWINDENCNEPFGLIVKSKTAKNITQQIDDANNTTASPGDTIEYTLTAQNIGNIAQLAEFDESLIDVLEYSELVDASGGSFDEETKTVSWPSQEIQPDESISRTITVKVKDEIPATPTSVGDPESFNLVMTNVFGSDSVEIKVTAPVSKVLELVVKDLPNTGAGSNALMMSLTAMLVSYFYLRNRQMSKELSYVRNEFNCGKA